MKLLLTGLRKNRKPVSMSNDVKISIVDFTEDCKPVVYDGLVYESCFIDFDGDLVLKDDVHGVKIFSVGLKDDNFYNVTLLKTIENHPVNLLKQISQDGKILEGRTLELQKILNKHYEQISRVRCC